MGFANVVFASPLAWHVVSYGYVLGSANFLEYFLIVYQSVSLVKRCEVLLAGSTLSSGSGLTSSSSRWYAGCGAGWVIAFATCLLPLLIERICTKQPIWKE